MIEKNLNPTAQPLDVDNTTLLNNSLDGSFNKPLNRQPNTDSELKGDTGGNKNPPDAEDMDDLGWNLNDNNDGFGVDDVNRDNDSSLSTDLRDKFGDYGSIFSDILSQLESLFNDGRDLVEHVNGGTNGSSVFSSFLHAISAIADRTDDDETINLTNAVTQMMSFYMQMISSQMQNQFNVQQWQIQNEYNSPAEQLKRLSAAGLNPLHYFDSGSNGSSTSVTASSGSAPSAGSAAGGPSKFARAMGIANTVLGVGSSVASTAVAGKQVAMQAAKLPGEIAQQAQNVVESEQRVGTARAEQALAETKQQQIAQDTAFSKEMQPLLLKASSNNLQLQGQDMVIKGQMSDKIAAENENLIQQTKLAVQDYLYNEGMNDLKMDFTKADIARTYSLVKEQDSITTLNNLRADFQKTYGIPSESNLSYFLAQKIATGEWTRDQYMDFLNDLKLFTGSSSSNPIIYSSNVIAERLAAFIRMFTDASSYNTEPLREYERLGQQMKTATEALQDELNTYSADEINSVNGKF